ncbi:hypothetical protein SAMN02745704_02736 [Paucidesulfovibrio gracilis DSM 16080]|jgi:hypothetical protein|uniref:Uncharacterized protein n=1 Tax=Paucidesulfovibrio gracilis DSM 16080 TaxID=1121449 RepID=A0A1T4Y596_9BACT|nr:hypothetical protein [Paucidesulfovibrio gracilis]SKA96491.1 hypothetical protein SAMN02745704_02736 [Paucidesulfovibrio gracilis DSM 16080]
MIFSEYLEKIEGYVRSGDLAFEFENGEEEQRGEILDFLERLMDLAEECDELATRLIFKDAYMERAEVEE